MKTKNSANKLMKILAPAIAFIFLISGASAKELDPLNATEMANALNLSIPHQRRSSAINTGLPTPETLLVERRPADKNNPGIRLADIYRYDYERDETIHTIFDVNQQKVISSESHQFMQLPLTANEIDRATDIIFDDAEQLGLLKNEYRRITGNYLVNPDQLHIKAFSFSSDTMAEQLNQASLQCGLNRCAQLLLYTHDSIVFEVSPIVNLSVGLVTQNIGY